MPGNLSYKTPRSQSGSLRVEVGIYSSLECIRAGSNSSSALYLLNHCFGRGNIDIQKNSFHDTFKF